MVDETYRHQFYCSSNSIPETVQTKAVIQLGLVQCGPVDWRKQGNNSSEENADTANTLWQLCKWQIHKDRSILKWGHLTKWKTMATVSTLQKDLFPWGSRNLTSDATVSYERQKQQYELQYCCSEVLQTAINAAMKPLTLTLTSVTVQIPTPSRTTKMLSLVSLEYRILSKTTSNKQDTGIRESFAIC